MKKLVLILAAALSPHLCMAADWELVTETTSGDVFHMDFSSIATVGKYRKAWVQVTNANPKESVGYPKKTYLSSRRMYMFDCQAKMLGVTQSVLYAEKYGKGQVVDTDASKFDPDRHLSDVVPDSVGESVLQAACGTNKDRAQIRAKNVADLAAIIKRINELERESDPAARRATKAESDTATEL